ARGTHAHRIARGQCAAHIGERTRLAAADLDDELRRTLHRARASGKIDAALEAIAGITHEPESLHLALDHRGIPERAFEVDACRIARDTRVLAAHDAGES